MMYISIIIANMSLDMSSNKKEKRLTPGGLATKSQDNLDTIYTWYLSNISLLILISCFFTFSSPLSSPKL